MSTLQVRNLPEDVHRTLKTRAAAAGQSLSEYVLGELITIARRPTLVELSQRIRHREAVDPATRAAEILRMERDEPDL